MEKNIFITGLPGTGKTTLIRKIVSALGQQNMTGFYTEEIREENSRLGFKVKTLLGNEGMMAHVGTKSRYRVGKYGVDIRGFEQVAIPSMDCYNEKVSIIVIDEIGKMECFSELFKQKVVECLDSEKRVLATAAFKGGAFIDSLKKRSDVSLIQLTEKNRKQVLQTIVAELAK